MRIGYAIQRMRKERQWTQARLAKEAGLSPGTVFNAESGAILPCRETFRKICKALGSPEYIVLLHAVREEDIPPEKMALWRDLKALMEEIMI